ncbi:MAG: hypothetical protein V3T86_14620 [Planctomycetota bacterium]
MRLLCALILATAPLLAQDSPAPDDLLKTNGEKPAPEIHKIYVPYEELDKVFGTDKERVMVPYKEFLELWKLKYGPKTADDEPAVPFQVDSAAYVGEISEGIAKFQATIEIEVFKKGWLRIPLAFKSVAFEEITVNDKPGVLTPTRAGYDLILKGVGRHKVTARFVAGVAKGKEFATTAFGLPSVPLHRLEFTVPGKGTSVRIEPARAHTVTTVGESTRVLAFLGTHSSVKLTWRYQPERTEREPSLIFSNDVLDLTVEERILRGKATFQLEILRTPAREFRIAVPERVQVIDVAASGLKNSGIKTWDFTGDDRRTLRIELHKEVMGKFALQLSIEAPVKVPGTIGVPAFRVETASRERGFLRVLSAEGVGLRVGRTENIFQSDVRTLPNPIRGGTSALGFRFPALPYTLTLESEQVAPRVTLMTRARLSVERQRMTLQTDLDFTVERAGLFDLRIAIPDGIVLTKVGDPSLVEAWRETKENGKRILVVELRGRRSGKFRLPLEAVSSLDLSKGELSVPIPKVQNVDREEGTLGVFLDPAIKATAKTEGVVPLEPNEFRKEDRYRPAKKLPLSFAWRWRGGTAKVDFKIEPRKPKVTCEVRYEIQGEESRAHVQATLVYTVQYSGVDTFRFRVPKRIVEMLQIQPNRKIKEKPHADDPLKDGEEPTVTYTVKLQGHELGEIAIGVEFDDVFENPLANNDDRRVAVPAFEPLDVERARTYVAIRKAAALKVEIPTDQYTQIDAAELPAALRTDDVYLALRRLDKPAAFPMDLTKHEYKRVADLVVRHVHLETVLSEENRAATTAFFEVLNNDRQFLAVRLPDDHEILELMVDGKPEKPRIGQEGVLLVPLLTGQRKDRTFQVAIAYTHPIDTSGAMFETTTVNGPELPAAEDSEAPFQALLTWNVHYPRGWEVTSYGGTVEPAGRDSEYGSWLQLLLGSVSRFVQPVVPPTARRDRGRMPNFKNIVPVYTERESVQMTFTNGTGNGVVSISHTSTATRGLVVLFAAFAAAAGVFFAARKVPPSRAGGLIAVVALVFLSGSGRAWTPFWNGALVATLVVTLVLIVRERRGAKA